MVIALVVAAVCGLFCAYGTSTVEIPGFEITVPYLLTIFYSRLLIGLVIGLSEDIKLLRRKLLSSTIRGALMGAIVSIGISFYSGSVIFITAGIVYGMLADLLSTTFGSRT
jgi:hypothetical protein